MDIVLVVLAFVCLAVGLVGCIVPVIPGPPIGYGGLVLMKLSGHSDFSLTFMSVWLVVTLVVTLADFYLPVYMTKRFGGSRAAKTGAALGLVAGIFLFPPLGMIVCPIIGAFVGEMWNDHANTTQAFKVAWGSFLAFFLGTGVKLIACGLMVFYAIRTLVV